MAEQFSGFPPEALAFFNDLERHNNREWFLAHKDIYERACRQPMQQLVAALEPRFGKSKISRINRDIRFFERPVALQDEHLRQRRQALHLTVDRRPVYRGRDL